LWIDDVELDRIEAPSFARTPSREALAFPTSAFSASPPASPLSTVVGVVTPLPMDRSPNSKLVSETSLPLAPSAWEEVEMGSGSDATKKFG